MLCNVWRYIISCSQLYSSRLKYSNVSQGADGCCSQLNCNISLKADEFGSNLVRKHPGADGDVKQTSMLVKIDAGAFTYGASLMADSGALIAAPMVVVPVWVIRVVL